MIEKLKLTIPYSSVKDIENMDEQRITKTRVVLTGPIIGLLWKKQFLYTVIHYNDGLMDQAVILDCGGRFASQVQKIIYEGMLKAKSTNNK